MEKFMDKLRRFMGKSTTDENDLVNDYLDEEEYYESEEEGE